MITYPQILQMVSRPDQPGYFCPLCSEKLKTESTGYDDYMRNTCYKAGHHGISIVDPYFFLWFYFNEYYLDLSIDLSEEKTLIRIYKEEDGAWGDEGKLVLSLNLDFIMEISNAELFQKQMETYLLFS
jgi:hypothetical protein